MAPLRRWLILSHRYLGIALGALVVVWFVSGIAMIYAGGMPALSEAERLERLPPLDLASVRRTPLEAAEAAGLAGPVDAVTLRTVEGRPAYRLRAGGRTAVVFADTGATAGPVDATRARSIAARFAGAPPQRVRHESRLLRPDQWTIAEGGSFPLHRLSVEDGRGSTVYVAEPTGEVVQWTTGRERALAWVAAIPHWLYLTPLRLRADLWRQVILWTSGLASVLAALGLVLAVVQLRTPAGPGRLSRIASRIPYRGSMRWHYVTGALFGVFVLTWLVSGLLSMEPGGWAVGGGLDPEPVREELAGGGLAPGAFPEVDAERWREAALPVASLRELRYRRILGEPYFAVRTAPPGRAGTEGPGGGSGSGGAAGYGDGPSAAGPGDVLVHAETMERARPVPDDVLVERVRSAHPGVEIEEVERLEAYDAYHYARDGGEPLPVLRVKMADPDRTWLYLDPAAVGLVGRVDRLDRVERWLYHGLHSLDFGFWYDRRPLWDVGMIALLLGGLATSGLGLFLGVRRLRRTWAKGRNSTAV